MLYGFIYSLHRCRPGWEGNNCDQCVTHVACKHGKCRSRPWECVCEDGYGGPMCDRGNKDDDKRQRYFLTQTFVYLFINKFFRLFSLSVRDSDLNFCGRNSPCSNYAVCHNTGESPDFYRCVCPEGYGGADCSQAVDPCQDPSSQRRQCLNDGECFNNNGTAQCRCASGWSGGQCDTGTRIV